MVLDPGLDRRFSGRAHRWVVPCSHLRIASLLRVSFISVASASAAARAGFPESSATSSSELVEITLIDPVE